MTSPLVHLQKLTKTFGDLTALDQCELEIAEGEVFGLLGPNGAGKSTLLRLLLGFMRPTSGRAKIDGLDCHVSRVSVHKQLAYLPGDARLPKTMRARQVLRFFSGLSGTNCYEQSVAIAERLELDLTRWVAFMSTGMRQKLSLAVTFASKKRLLILDEPTANLDPTVRGEVMKMVAEAKSEGRTVIFSSHVLSEVEEVCDRAGILRDGKLVHLQDMSQLMRQHRIRARVLGDIPPVPESFGDDLTVIYLADDQIQFETPGDLSILLRWLAQVPIDNVFIQPVGLRSVYDQVHDDREEATT